jgi:Tetratricopeptide repeat protein 7 N-terminal
METKKIPCHQHVRSKQRARRNYPVALDQVKDSKRHPSVKFVPIKFLKLSSEAMAVRNAVLSQSPEFKEQRLKAFETACNAYNLLVVCLARWGQIKLFHEV